jgi:hypothetical protein
MAVTFSQSSTSSGLVIADLGTCLMDKLSIMGVKHGHDTDGIQN